MKKAYILFLLYPITVIMATAQNNPNDLYLTNYTIQSGSDAIGFVKIKSGDIESVHISGTDAKAFHLDNQHQLLVHQNELKERASAYLIF